MYYSKIFLKAILILSSVPSFYSSSYLILNEEIFASKFLISYFKVFSLGNVSANATEQIVGIKQRDKTIVE